MGLHAGPSYKSVYFYMASSLATLQADTANLVAFLNANIATVMYNTSWGDSTFMYDYGTYPTFNMANGSRSNYVNGGGSASLSAHFFGFNPGFSCAGYGTYNTLQTTNFIAVAFLTWARYPSATGVLDADIERVIYTFGAVGTLPMQISASMVAQWYNNSPPSLYPYSPYPPLAIFDSEIATVACPVDQDGSHTGQVLQMVIPTVNPIVNISPTSIPGYTQQLFGEFRKLDSF